MAEILSPAGSPEALQAALRCGCDALYVGGRSFSARANAANFSDSELADAVRLCHERGVKLYLAINTVILDSQLDECMRAVGYAAKIGVDALITQDLCLVEIVRKCCPQLEIHASTQMTLHTKNGVQTAGELGFSRAVLSRELPEAVIAELSQLGIETEIFVHGALCMSVSGQCYMSALIGSRSANRGLCAQACRLAVSAVKGQHRYDLSLKDMSLLDVMPRVLATGAASLKIEGRMKRPEYAAKATDSAYKACRGLDPDMDGLAAVFSRGGFTKGYFEARTGAEMFGRRDREDAAVSASVLPQLHELYRSEFKRDIVRFALTVRQGSAVRLVVTDTHGNSFSASGDDPQTAQNKGLSADQVEKQLKKLGDTIYEYGGCECDIGDMLYVSPAQINALRRQVCEGLDAVRAAANDRSVPFEYADITGFEGGCECEQPRIRIEISSLKQLENIDLRDIEFVIMPLEMCKNADLAALGEKLMAALPRFTFDEENVITRLKVLKERGLRHILAANLAHIKIGRELGLTVHGGFGLNVTNSVAARVLGELGVSDITASFELKTAQIRALKKPVPVGYIGYGRLPAMLTVNCPIRQAVGCGRCEKRLYDPTGRELAVRCSKGEGYVEILNSDVLFTADKTADFKGAAFVQLCFDEENAQQAADIVSAYKNGEKAQIANITRGLYYRGII
ncbi:MAG: U32 family peptidase [Ruminococcus sp.]|nr:U32 family peptidase [Ruminococcus sp.]